MTSTARADDGAGGTRLETSTTVFPEGGPTGEASDGLSRTFEASGGSGSGGSDRGGAGGTETIRCGSIVPGRPESCGAGKPRSVGRDT